MPEEPICSKKISHTYQAAVKGLETTGLPFGRCLRREPLRSCQPALPACVFSMVLEPQDVSANSIQKLRICIQTTTEFRLAYHGLNPSVFNRSQQTLGALSSLTNTHYALPRLRQNVQIPSSLVSPERHNLSRRAMNE